MGVACSWGNASVGHFLSYLAIWASLQQAMAQNTTNPCDCEAEDTELSLPLWASLPIIAFLVMLSGLFSGLTLGLMSLDVIGLQIVQKGDDKELARCAEKIAPIRESGNQLLCTLLLGNVAVNSALSILTADIASGLVGFLVSTALIVVFGEILPQAACSRYALQVGARTVPIVRFLMMLFFVITKPMSIILDWMLGREVGTIHSRTELMEMLKLQISLGAVSAEEGKIAQQVAEGALSFRDKSVGDIMTPLEDVKVAQPQPRSLQDVALVGDDAKIFAKVLAILAGEAFDRDRASCLWLVGRLEVLLTALRSLGDLLEKLRSAERANFLTRLGKLNIHVDDAGNEGFGTIRTIASAALNRGLDEQQIAQRPKVLTTIRSMRPALRPNDTLMCLFDVTALSLGVATSRGTQLVEDEAELQRLRGALLTLRIHGEEELQVECSTLGGAVVLSLELPAQSTVADLEERMVTALGDSWKNASFWLGEHQVSQQSRLMNCDTLVVKEEKDALMTCLIQRNTTVPTRTSKLFTVASPGQQSVWLQILEGELPFAKDNHVVGQLRLDGLQPAAGMGDRPLVEVGFDLDANDVLHVTAADLGLGASSKASFPFDARWRVHPQDLERAVQRAEQVWKVKSTIQDRSDLFDHCCRALRQQRGDDAETTELLKMMAVVDEADIADDVDYKAQLQALVATQNHTAAIEDLD